MATQQSQEPQAVAGLPRLFVGQVPTDKNEDDLLHLFDVHGEVETIMVVRGPDQKSRGCAMVQMKKWAAAEAAMEALNGTSPLEGSKERPLVVNFANPRRGTIAVPGEIAIAPRKLFIRQIPRDCTDADITKLFSKFGDVENVNVVGQQPARCAFVQFKKWAACEAAIEELNETHVMPGCDHPLVVKFADARRPNNPHPHPHHLHHDNIPLHPNHSLHQHHQQDSIDSSQSYAYTRSSSASGHSSAAGVGGKKVNGPAAVGGGPAHHHHHQGNATMHQSASYMMHPQHPGMMPQHSAAAGGVYLGHHPHHLYGPHQQHLTEMMATFPPSAQHHHHHLVYQQQQQQQQQHGAVMGMPTGGLSTTLINGANRRSGNGGRLSSSFGAASSRRGLSSGGENGSTDSLGEISDVSEGHHHLNHHHNHQGQLPRTSTGTTTGIITTNGTSPVVPPLMTSAGAGGGGVVHLHHPDMSPALHHHHPSHYGSMQTTAAAAAAAYMGYPMVNMAPPHMANIVPPPGGKVGRGVIDPGVYAHKLFVGQVPFEVTEQDLWHIFAPYGDILELAVLRSGGMSKGCAFLTYASRQQALYAMSTLHGQHVGPNKRMVVKFADHKAGNINAE